MAPPPRSPLPGGESALPPGAVPLGPVDPDQSIEVSVTVRPRQPLEDLDAQLNRLPTREQPYLSREEFAATYGADAADLTAVEDFAREYGLRVVESSPARRTVRLEGRAADINNAFGVTLVQYRFPDGSTFRGYAGDISVPTDLVGVVQGAFGLDTRPIAARRGT